MPDTPRRLRRWLMSLVFCAGGIASELRFPLAGVCPPPVRAQRWRARDGSLPPA